jgi:hypothetical protein
MKWTLTKDSQFDVSSYFEVLRGAREVTFPWKSIWCAKVSKWVAFFLWTTPL